MRAAAGWAAVLVLSSCAWAAAAATAAAPPPPRTRLPRRALRADTPPDAPLSTACSFVHISASTTPGAQLAGYAVTVGAAGVPPSSPSSSALPPPPRLALGFGAAPLRAYALQGASPAAPAQFGSGAAVEGPYGLEGLEPVFAPPADGDSPPPRPPLLHLWAVGLLASGPPPAGGDGLPPPDGARPPVVSGTTLLPALVALSPPDPAGGPGTAGGEGWWWWDDAGAACERLSPPAQACPSPGPCEAWWACCGGGARVRLPAGALRLIRPADAGPGGVGQAPPPAAPAPSPSPPPPPPPSWLSTHGPALGGGLGGGVALLACLGTAAPRLGRRLAARHRRRVAASIPSSKAFPPPVAVGAALKKMGGGGGGGRGGGRREDPGPSTTLAAARTPPSPMPALPLHIRHLSLTVPCTRVDSGALTLPCAGGGGSPGPASFSPSPAAASPSASSTSSSYPLPPSAAARRRVAAKLAGLAGQPGIARRWTFHGGEVLGSGGGALPHEAGSAPPSPAAAAAQGGARLAAGAGATSGGSGDVGGRLPATWQAGELSRAGSEKLPVWAKATAAAAAAAAAAATATPAAQLSPPHRPAWAWPRLCRFGGVGRAGDGTPPAPPSPSPSPGPSSAVVDPLPVPEVDLAAEVVICERLGSGASGTVHRGLWKGREVAVKLLRAGGGGGGGGGGGNHPGDSLELASFRQEVAVLARIRHPHVVSLLAACLTPPAVGLILELVPGGSLADRLAGRPQPALGRNPPLSRAPPPPRPRPGPLPYPHLLRIGLDVATALAALHTGRPAIVHRDLKPANILLRAGGRAALADFGIARTTARTWLSTVATAAGTPQYMAPEQFEGRPLTAAVDAWAFGVVLWECATGRPPFAGSASPMQVIYAVGVAGKRLAPPSRTPPPVASLMRACWATDPAGRPSLGEAAGVLRVELARVGAARGAAAAARARGLGGWGVGGGG